jgi:acetylornithine deacetylase/succinyl-diaminopimelate desuccinylase-like protein
MPLLAALATATLFASATMAEPTMSLRPDQTAFHDLFKEMVETNTTASSGSCTKAAQQVAARLKAAGYGEADLHLFADPARPQDGGLVAVLPGRNPKAKAVLLLAHIDVVEARREDWTRDPFTLFEEGGYYYGRGVFDDKYHAAIWSDLMIRYKQEGFRPEHTVKMALTCGEEGSGLHGIDWLLRNHRDWVEAGFALNEGGVGEKDDHGARVLLGVQTAEKVYQDYKLEVTNPGGHSSQPLKENAITRLSAALVRLGDLEFPTQLNDTTRAYFSRLATIKGGETGAAMAALVKNLNDPAAAAIINQNKAWHSQLRTTCVATMLNGGHATNALPQRANANINCRIFPGDSVPYVLKTLTEAVNDPLVKVSIVPPETLTPPPPALTPQIMKPIEQVAAEIYPGIPVVPKLETFATDGIYTNSAGIPTYGVWGLFVDGDLGNIHGLNERIGVKSLYEGRDFLYRLVKLYTK